MVVGSEVVGSEVIGENVGINVGNGVGCRVVGSEVVGSEVVGSDVLGTTVGVELGTDDGAWVGLVVAGLAVGRIVGCAVIGAVDGGGGTVLPHSSPPATA